MNKRVIKLVAIAIILTLTLTALLNSNIRLGEAIPTWFMK
ncbi:hypothetical protein SAMN04487885_1115 [Clostridium cadaveris]|mgnify:CR=1 FL=1|uniref:Uncharacterized protein n=1 Tax=Clostridium cadaveris TaxID=1529 RepID=A0A1I2LPP2_9CLOT|nr:hypothetical protein SAMN04487885_1115 [Clostridium cadaveris]